MGLVGGVRNTNAAMRWRAGARGTRPARGQSLVEFALVLPLFLLLVFAVVEYSLINSAIGSYNFAAKDAARLGAILGPTDGSADTQMLAIINSHVLGVVAAKPVEVDIFEATEAGTYATSALQDIYLYQNGGWVPSGTQTWPPGTTGVRDDRLVSQDYLGVRISYQYTYVTAFFSSIGATINLTAISVQRIEPQELRTHPAPGSQAAIAALDPPPPLAPLFALVALPPLWILEARRIRGVVEKERRS